MESKFLQARQKKKCPGTARTLKALGVRVQFTGSMENGAQGKYEKGTVLIAKDAQDPLKQVYGHEITHRMQELAPTEYADLRESVRAELGSELEFQVQSRIQLYARHNISLSYEEALDEVTADWAGELIRDGKVLEDFIQRNRENRTLLEKLRDAIRGLISKLTGKEQQQVRTAEERLSAALDAAAKQAEKNTAMVDGDARYSLMSFDDGKRFVEVNIDQERFDGLSKNELRREAVSVIKSKFAGKVIGIDNPVFVNGRTASEYGFPSRQLDQQSHEAKMRASTGLDNLLDAGANFRTEPDGRDGHIHTELVGDFRYFDVIFKVGNDFYSGVINIEPLKKGLLLKDITKIRNITEDICSSYGSNPKSTFLRDVSMNSISDPDGKSNGKFSISSRDMSSEQIKSATENTGAFDRSDPDIRYSIHTGSDMVDTARLRQENELLRERVEYWKGQTRRSKGATTP